MRLRSPSNFSFKAFTLIELLVVIAVIGVLAGAIIVAINPTEQIARGSDAGRKSSAQQLADGINGFYVARNALPVASTTWVNDLMASGDIKTLPSSNTLSPVCTNNAQNGYCYLISGTTFAVYTRLASNAEENKCNTNGNTYAYYFYSSADAKSGIICGTGTGGTTDPSAVAQGAGNYH